MFCNERLFWKRIAKPKTCPGLSKILFETEDFKMTGAILWKHEGRLENHFCEAEKNYQPETPNETEMAGVKKRNVPTTRILKRGRIIVLLLRQNWKRNLDGELQPNRSHERRNI